MKRRRSAGVPTSSDASRRYHNRVAGQYDAIYEDAYWQFHDRLTWASIRPHLPADLCAPCCDLGCGAGKWGLHLLKSGYPVTFVDHAANMIAQVRDKLPALGKKAEKATLLTADIVNLAQLADESFALILAMGDPLSICSDPAAAAREMFRLARPGGWVIATADNKLAALEHYLSHGSLQDLQAFVHSGRTQWLTQDQRERFALTTFTPADLCKLFQQAGFEVMGVRGKTILPLRKHQNWLNDSAALAALLRLEEHLARDPSAAAAAGHLQISARRPHR
jgi:ubiquinone/menaquinone biosynthesis C-methylase UbiE